MNDDLNCTHLCYININVWAFADSSAGEHDGIAACVENVDIFQLRGSPVQRKSVQGDAQDKVFPTCLLTTQPEQSGPKHKLCEYTIA